MFVILASTLGVKAQTHYSFKRIDINSGLKGNSVFDIIQDKDGFIWTATNNGLQKFDMYDFVEYPDVPSDVNNIFIDRTHGLWASSSNGILFYDLSKKAFSRIPVVLNGKEMQAFSQPKIVQDSKGRIWLSTRIPDTFVGKKYLLVYNKERCYFESYQTVLPAIEAEVLGLYDDTRSLWLETADGLVQYSEKNGYSFKQMNDQLDGNYIQSIRADEAGNFAILTWEKFNSPVFHYIGSDKKQKKNFRVGEVRDILFDNKKGVWLAGQSLQRFNTVTLQIETIQLPDDIRMINSIYQDREGNIWLGTYHGILIMNPEQQVTNRPNQTFSGENFAYGAMSLLKTYDGSVLAGSWAGGLFIYDQQLRPKPALDNFSPAQFEDIKKFPQWALLEDRERNIWIGAQHGHLFEINRKTKTVRHISDSAFRSETIRIMTEDLDGNIWLGTQRGLLVKWSKKDDRPLKIIQRDSTFGGVTGIAEFENYIWVAAGTDLFQVDRVSGRIVQKFNHTLNVSGRNRMNLFNRIVEVFESKLVISSAEGLIFFNTLNGTFELHKLPSSILSVEVIQSGKVYVMALTDGSLVEYGPNKLKYLEKGNYYNPNSSAKIDDDLLVFGTETGVAIVQRNQEIKSGIMPPPEITSIQVLNEQVNVDSVLSGGLNLDYNENHFSITYSALSFRERHTINYYYRIRNLQNEFIDVGSQRTLIYTRLPHGKYELDIYYMMPDGRRSPAVSLKIDVLPPFWKKAWFIVLVSFAALSFLSTLYWFRISKIRGLARIREEISRDLHDDMGSNISTIHILSNVARGTLERPENLSKGGEMLDKISALSFQVMETIDEIVWSVNPKNDLFEETVARMRLVGGQMLEDQNINYKFIVDGNPAELKLDLKRRNDLYLIYKEAITNIAKHAQCRNVVTRLSIKKGCIALLISDDGTGFDQRSSAGGNGLNNIRKRAKNLKAKLRIESETNKGTLIELEFRGRSQFAFVASR